MARLTKEQLSLARDGRVYMREGTPIFHDHDIKVDALDTIAELEREFGDVRNERKLCIPLHEAVAEKDKAIARLVAPGPCPRKHPMWAWKAADHRVMIVGEDDVARSVAVTHCILCDEVQAAVDDVISHAIEIVDEKDRLLIVDFENAKKYKVVERLRALTHSSAGAQAAGEREGRG